MDHCVPRRCVEVGSVLAPERALLSDLRYVHLLDVARGVDATDIITIRPDGNRSVADLERPYQPLLLKMLQASCHSWTCTKLDEPVLHSPATNKLTSLHKFTVKLFTAGCCMWAARHQFLLRGVCPQRSHPGRCALPHSWS